MRAAARWRSKHGSTIPPCLLLDNVVPPTFGITGLCVGRANLHEPVSYTADGKSILFRHGDFAIEIHAHGYQERLGPVFGIRSVPERRIQ